MPPKASSSQILEAAFQQVLSIANNSNFETTCAKCQAGLQAAKFLALAAPELGPELAVRLCEHFDFNSDCPTQFGVQTLGAAITQVIAAADVGGLDGQVTSPQRRFFLGSRAFDDRDYSSFTTNVGNMQPLHLRSLSASSYVSFGPHQLVREAKAQPTACSKEAVWQALEGSAFV